MSRIISDAEIESLLQEQKPLAASWRSRLIPKPRANQKSWAGMLSICGADGHNFQVTARQNPHNIMDFSVILTFCDGDGTEYNLIRCNGKHPSEHTNKWEKKAGTPTIPIRNQFHIHCASERYQLAGLAIEGFAEATTEYSSLETAVEFFIANYGLTLPDRPQKQFDFK